MDVASSVEVAVAVPVAETLQAVNKTIQILTRKRDFILHAPLFE